MKKLTYLLIGFALLSNVITQSAFSQFSTINNEQYKLYFPIETQLALFIPTTDYVCILPTNEKDTIHLKKVNEYYKQSLINYFPTISGQIKKIITDKEALNEDLSNVNIHAFGTIESNLWISRFMEKAKDFPLKITKDSIIAERIYYGANYAITALWYNPDNVKYSVTLYIPQNLANVKSFGNRRLNTFQYAIFENGQIAQNSFYILRDGHWEFSLTKDTILKFRDVNHLWQSNYEKIENFYYRYPTLNQLETCFINEKDVPIDTIRIKDINLFMGNSSDLDWLKPIAENYKTILVGEGHHLKYNKNLLLRILFSINRFDKFPVLILELPYSYTDYINYFISLKSDKDAQRYSDSVLSKLDKVDLPMFEKIREWNKVYPDKKVQIGCSDLEQNFFSTIDNILNPYLVKVNAFADLSYSSSDSLKSYLLKEKYLMNEAKDKNVTGEFPFETPIYMESVYNNLATSIPIKLNPKNFTDHSLRFKVMIRNVTDDAFLGKLISNNKSIFYGGNEHFRILNDGSNKKAVQTEGYFLAHYFEPTKNNVYSISMNTLAFSISDSIPLIDPSLNYKMENDLIKLFYERKIKLNEPVVDPYFSEFQNYFYKLSYKYPEHAFRINKINLTDVLNKYQGMYRYMIYIAVKNYADFNTSIMISSSPIGD